MRTAVLIGLATALAYGQTARRTAPASPDFATLAKQAEAARARNAPEAAALFQKALRARPGWKEGWWALGSLFYSQDKYAECGEAFDRLTSLEPGSGAAWSMLGLCEFGIRRYDLSLAHLRRGQELGVPTEAIDGVSKFQLAKLLTKTGSFEQALAIFHVLAESGKSGAAYLNAAGLAALWKPLLPEEIPPTERELVFFAGKAFWDAAGRRAPEARASFESLLARYPDSTGVHYLYGSFALSDNPDRAIGEFENELKVSPKHAGALAAITAEYLRRGEPSKGLPYARKCLEYFPESPVSHTLLGRTLAETGDLEGGLKELEAARKLNPDEPQTRIALASVYAKLGRQEDAARERREFLRLKASAAKPEEAQAP